MARERVGFISMLVGMLVVVAGLLDLAGWLELAGSLILAGLAVVVVGAVLVYEPDLTEPAEPAAATIAGDGVVELRDVTLGGGR